LILECQVNVEKVGGQRLQDLELYNGLDTVIW